MFARECVLDSLPSSTETPTSGREPLAVVRTLYLRQRLWPHQPHPPNGGLSAAFGQQQLKQDTSRDGRSWWIQCTGMRAILTPITYIAYGDSLGTAYTPVRRSEQ